MVYKSSVSNNSGGGGGSVNSVTGLNTNNADPTNPVVQISVDGVTITGAGTPGSPLVSVGGGGTGNVLSVNNSDGTLAIFPTAGLVVVNIASLSSGNILIGNVSGVATGRALVGDATLANNGTITLATVNSNVGSFGSQSSIPVVTFNGKGLATAASTIAVVAPAGTLSGTTIGSTVVTSSLTTVGTLVNLTVTNPITGSITGNAATATSLQNARNIGGVSFNGTADIVPQTIQTVDDGSDTTTFPLFGNASGTQSQQPKTNASFSYNSVTSNLTVGTVTGTLSGNASTATALQTPRAINGVNFDGTAAITVPAAAGTLTGTTIGSTVVTSSLTTVGTLVNLTVTNPITGSITGNAGTSTALQTGRTINAVTFDGTANIVVPAAAGTLTGTTIGTTVVTSTLTSVGILTGGATGVGFTVNLGSSTIAGTLATIKGGTGLSTLTGNAVMIGAGTSNVAFATIGTAGRVLIDQGAGVNPSFNVVSGDITVTNTGITTIGPNAVTNAKLSTVPNLTAKGNVSGATATPVDLTTTQITTLINLFSSGLSGATPASGGGSSNFLRADGTWTTPAGGGTVTQVNTGRGLTGGPITNAGTVSIATNTINTLAGFNSNGDFSSVTPGTNLTLSGGTLNATGGGGGASLGLVYAVASGNLMF